MVAGELEKYCTEEQVEELKRKAIEPAVVEKTEKCSAMLTDDPKLNYVFGSKGSEVDIEYKEITTVDKYDYGFVSKEEAEHDIKEQVVDYTDMKENGVADKRKTLSYMSVDGVEQGIEWYRENFPKVPEDLYPLMARWSFGDLSTITKKDIKNDTKRLKQGKKAKKLTGLEVHKGNFVVEF